MRIIFGLLSLLVALAIVGVLVKKQLGILGQTNPINQSSPAASGTVASPGPSVAADPNATVRQQSQQIQQQFKQAAEAAMQQARPVDDK